MQLANLIRYIVWYATQQDTRLTTNRLVKFVYLADLYFARIKKGQTLTGLPWRFVHYGPYCGEVWRAIHQAAEDGLICKKSYESNFADFGEYDLFWCPGIEAGELGEQIHIGVLGQLQNAIRKFGDDTPQLLDYVYFETEPMKNVRKGDLLDFSLADDIRPVKKVKLKKLSPETVKQAREKIRKLSDGVNADKERLRQSERERAKYKDDLYYRFLEYLNGEELEVGLKGTAKIEIT